MRYKKANKLYYRTAQAVCWVVSEIIFQNKVLLLRRSRLVRSSTVWTRPTSSTAPSARSPSAPRSCRRTWTLWFALLSRLSPLQLRVSISVPAPSLPPWAPVLRSTPPSTATNLLHKITPESENSQGLFFRQSTTASHIRLRFILPKKRTNSLGCSAFVQPI